MNQLQSYHSPKKRVNITLPVKLLAMIDQTFPDKKRSQVLAEGAIAKIEENEKKQRQQDLKKSYQYSNKLYASEHKEWENIMVQDAPDEEYES